MFMYLPQYHFFATKCTGLRGKFGSEVKKTVEMFGGFSLLLLS